MVLLCQSMLPVKTLGPEGSGFVEQRQETGGKRCLARELSDNPPPKTLAKYQHKLLTTHSSPLHTSPGKRGSRKQLLFIHSEAEYIFSINTHTQKKDKRSRASEEGTEKNVAEEGGFGWCEQTQPGESVNTSSSLITHPLIRNRAACLSSRARWTSPHSQGVDVTR